MDTLSKRRKLNGEIKLLESQFKKNMAGANLSGAQANQIDALLQGKIDLNAANVDNVIAGTGLKGEQAAELKALLAGKIAQQASTLRFTDSKSDTNEQMLPINVGIGNAKIGFTEAQTKGVEANTLAQTLSNNATQTAQDNTTLEADLLAQVNNPEYANANGITTPEQAQSAFLELVKTSNLPLERQLAIEQTVNKFGLAELQGEATKLAANAKAAMAKGGLDGLTKWYDGVDDPTDGEPTSLRVLRENGEVKVLRKVGEQESVLFSAAGEGAEGQVSDFMMNQITNPGTSMTVAATVLEMEKSKASIDSTKTQTNYQEIVNDNQRLKQELQNGSIQANTDLAVAQAMKIKQDAIANSGLTWDKEAAQKAYNSFVTGDTYAYAVEQLADEPTKLMLYKNQIQYDLGLIPQKPDIVPKLETWLAMTPRGRETFLK
jgi:putative NIF3 family GTP cyclohydrolase 1 type 2